MRTNSVDTVKEENLQPGDHRMGWMITIITPGESMIPISHLVFLDLVWETYLETRRDSLQEGHIRSMSSPPPVENLILNDSLLHPQKTEHSQKQIHLKRKPVSAKHAKKIDNLE